MLAARATHGGKGELVRTLVACSLACGRRNGTQGKKVFFVTNNASKSRQAYVKKMAGLGLAVQQVRRFSCTRAHGARHALRRGGDGGAIGLGKVSAGVTWAWRCSRCGYRLARSLAGHGMP